MDQTKDIHQTPIVKEIDIKGLFGVKDVHIDFQTNCRIIIGENGLGKTTILSIVNHLLSGKIELLGNYAKSFKSVSVKLDSDENFTEFDSASIAEFAESYKSLLEDYGSRALKKIESKLSPDIIDSIKSSKQLESIFKEDEYLSSMLGRRGFTLIGLKNLSAFLKNFNKIFLFRHRLKELNISVVYLPTYRRIEADLTKLMRFDSGYNSHPRVRRVMRANGSYAEVDEFREFWEEIPSIKFGMKDISEKIESIISKISESSVSGFSEVSGKMIRYLISPDKHDKHQTDFNQEEVKIVLQRVGDSMSPEDKDKLLELMNEGKIKENPNLSFFLASLLDVYHAQRVNDTALKLFAEACNVFLTDKKFQYDESKIKMNLWRILGHEYAEDEKMSLESLSSGEKQMVSILASVYLETEKQIIFLIDEPELSLSIFWQREFLPTILMAPNCNTLLAVTHSPFIFDNELRDTAIGSPEYITYPQ